MGEPAGRYLPHVRIPHAALDLCESPMERLCVLEVYTRADLERGEPFRYSSRDFRCGVLGAGAAKALWQRLEDAGLLLVHAPSVGRRAPLVTVTCQQRLCSESADPEHNGSTTGAQLEHKRSAGNDVQHDESGAARSTSGAQAEHKRSTSGALNARAEINLQPPTSNLHGSLPDPSSASEPTSPPEPPEAPSADAGSSGKPDHEDPLKDAWVEDLWEELDSIRRELNPNARRSSLTPKRRSAVKRAARDLRKVNMTRDDLLAAARWVHLSESPNASGARDTGNAIDVLLRPSHTVAYAEKAREGVGMRSRAGDGRQSAAETAWSNLLSNVRDHGRAALTNAPPEILAALNRAGGYRQLANITSDYERSRFRERFLSAYREAA